VNQQTSQLYRYQLTIGESLVLQFASPEELDWPRTVESVMRPSTEEPDELIERLEAAVPALTCLLRPPGANTYQIDLGPEPEDEKAVALDPVDMAICGNCDWHGLAEVTNPVSHLSQRVDPGGEMPVGECPKCGALAYLPDESEKVRVRRRAFLERWLKENRPFAFELEDVADEDLDCDYLVITIVEYDGQPDALETYWHGDLEACRAELEAHVFQDARDSYCNDAVVLNLAEECALGWITEQRVFFADEEHP
jgi:hypothetical protein